MTENEPTIKRPIKTALHQAVLDGRLHQVRLLVTNHGVNVDSQDVFGRSPLMYACLLQEEEYGYKMARIFLSSGAMLNVRDQLGRSAFSYACMKGRIKIVQRLLKEELLELNVPDNDGNTPLHHAALSGNPDVARELVQIMIRYGMPTDLRNTLGYTALLLACKYGHFVTAHIFMTVGKTSPTLRDNEFFLNARDWVQRSFRLAQPLTLRRNRTMPEIVTRFLRENTMYTTPLVPECQHHRRPPNPLGKSLKSALRLPSIYQKNGDGSEEKETMIDDRDARLVLLRDFDNFYADPKVYIPPSAGSGRLSHPRTAKLLAVAGRRTHHSLNTYDIKTIFEVYSDQYETGGIVRKSAKFGASLENLAADGGATLLPKVHVTGTSA